MSDRYAAALTSPWMSGPRDGPVAEIPVPEDSPLRREWSLVCDAPDLPACVTGWEHLGQDGCRDADRIFEVMWSVDPQVVRTAARIGTAPATAAFPAMTGPLEARLRGEPGPSSADLRRASGLIERTLDYLTRAARTVSAG
jgi:MerR family transcriptional regulator, light-induced transcriptional regulator